MAAALLLPISRLTFGSTRGRNSSEYRTEFHTDKIESHDYGIKLFSEVGKTFPLYCTALGKVLLAYGPAAERKRVLSLPMKPFTPKTITDARRLRQQLATVHEQGYALDSEEITRGII